MAVLYTVGCMEYGQTPREAQQNENLQFFSIIEGEEIFGVTDPQLAIARAACDQDLVYAVRDLLAAEIFTRFSGADAATGHSVQDAAEKLVEVMRCMQERYGLDDHMVNQAYVACRDAIFQNNRQLD